MPKIDFDQLERLVELSDDLDVKNVDDNVGKIIRHAVDKQIQQLESIDSDQMSKSQIEEERERLSKNVFGNDRRFKSEEQLSNENDGKSENFAEIDEISAERERLAKDVFRTEDN